MTPETVMEVGREAIILVLTVSAPMLLAALVTGLLISIFQAATQINEATLSFIPKLVAMFAALLILGPWMLEIIVDYMRRLFESIPQLIG